LSEKVTIDKVKSKQGLLSKIQNFFTFGYGTKEDLRELDKKLRDLYYNDLNQLRHDLEDIYLTSLETGQKASNRDLKKNIQVLDRIVEKVRHADYGYAGLMDRKGHIRNEELARVFDFDKTLSDEINSMKEAGRTIQGEVEGENWSLVTSESKKIKALLLQFEKKWYERENQFRPLDV
jgi:hypothetical protein